jgi:hypothetical protein
VSPITNKKPKETIEKQEAQRNIHKKRGKPLFLWISSFIKEEFYNTSNAHCSQNKN